jgi:hypothetical protein
MTVSRDSIRRLGGLAGIMFVVIGVFALFLPGTPPKADEVSKVTDFFVDKRGSILAANYIAGVALVFLLLFLAALRETFGAGGRDGIRPGTIALAGGIVAVVFILAGNAVFNGAAFQVASAHDENLNHALYDVANDLFFMSSYGFVVLFVGSAMAIRGTGALPGWLGSFALVAAVVNLLGPIGLFAKSGFFAIGGAFGFVAPLVSVLWVLAASVLMVRGAPAAGPATDPAAP